MKLTILGSGVLFPTKERFPSSFLLETKETKILLDCGHETIGRLVGVGVDPREIDGIFISHFHPDHLGDAFNLVHSRFVGDLIEKKKNRELIFWGPKTIEERFKKWREIYWMEPTEDYPLKFNEGTNKYSFKDVSIETFPIHHVTYYESVGVRISADDKIIFYPGDVGSRQDFGLLVEKARGADLMIIEGGDSRPTPNHFTTEQIKELAEKAGVKKTVIIHIQCIELEQKRIKDFVVQNKGFIIGEDKMIIEM